MHSASKKSGGRRKERKGRAGNFVKKVRKEQKKNLPQYVGIVQMTRDGYVFVNIEGQDDDVFVKSSKTRGALNGDKVRVEITRPKDAGRRMEGAITEVIERSRKPFVGILHIVGKQAWVLMQSRVMPYDISVEVIDGKPSDSNGGSGGEGQNHIGALRSIGNSEYAVVGLYETVNGERKEMTAHIGMKVAVFVDSWNRGEPNPKGHIVDVLGEPGDNDTEMHAILAEFALPYRFEPEVENAADSISEEIGKKELQGRKDFRSTLTFTIDPADAKDFDDALSFYKKPDGNYEVGVHIADVSYYVKPGSVVDNEARSRGTSVYLVDRTVPMLPEKLSNKLCSLRPNEDKLTFSAVFELTPDAKIVSRWFGRTVIRSDYRFAYETAQQIIEMGDEALEATLKGGTDGKHSGSDASGSAMGGGVYEGCVIPRECKEAILLLNSLAAKLRDRRFASGAINFERPEMKVEVDEKGRPVNVYQKITKEANWLIEEFMLLANRSVAEFIATGGKMNGNAQKDAKTFVYRIHDEPNAEKLAGLKNFAGNFGYKLDLPEDGKGVAKALNTLMAQSKEKPEFAAIELLALRSMAKATYSTDNIGHYGLAFRFYTHFTSPIRRYPDTMVHRLLAMYLAGEKSQSKEWYEEQCKYASEREVIAAEAERASVKYKLVEFMQDKVGAEFEGHISGLTEWGMYVEIEPTHIEGMVALRDVSSDFFEFDEANYRIVGKRSGTVYHLGDPVKIRVKATNLEQKLLDYELVTPETGNAVQTKSKDVGPQKFRRSRDTAGKRGKGKTK